MINAFIEHLLHLAIVMPFIFLTLQNRRKEFIKILFAFSIYFIIHSIVLYLPIEFTELSIIKGRWNWTGKIFAVLWTLLFLLFYKKFSPKDYFLSWKQNKDFLKYGLLTILVIFIAKGVFNYFYLTPSEWDLESLLFQSTMPGLDEELAFRGIMLGILVKILKPSSKIIFHPAIYITALLFGMGHGLFLSESYELVFNASSFVFTSIFGVVWAWMTINSGSVVLALVSHNLGNVTSQIISMSK